MRTPGPPLRQRLARSLGPARAPVKAGYDALFARALPRIAARRLRRPGRDGDALARAVDGIRGKGVSPEEREWIERIEGRRGEIAARPGTLELERPHHPEPLRSQRLAYSTLAGTASIHRPWGALLLRLVRELQPRSCLELGTAVGISAAYQAAGLELNGAGRLLTLDSSPELAELARETFDRLSLYRVETRVGVLDETLGDALAEAAPLDLAYLDAGKTRAGLLRQLDLLLPQLSSGAVVVIDDIHWSREMAGAWRAIRRDRRWEPAIDLWRVGLLRRRTGA
jgi:predicted O-methyltransferase YrrM